jgi:hypothetical protein
LAVAFLIVVFVFRREIGRSLSQVSTAINKITKANVLGISLEMDRIAEAAVKDGAEESGKITPSQVEAAARISIQARQVDSRAITDELDKLCLEYDGLRRTMQSGLERTRAMTRVLVKMRSLAPSASDHIDAYKSSGSPGSRLAAIAIMQMVPRCADLDWLRDRFSSEQQPFIFYHAALALQNVANNVQRKDEKENLRDVTRNALDAVKRFKGPPDRNTIEVLEMLLSSLDR